MTQAHVLAVCDLALLAQEGPSDGARRERPPRRRPRLGVGQLHLLSWLGVDGASVVAVADTDQARARSPAPSGPAVGGLDDLLDLGVDVVDVCTPPAAGRGAGPPLPRRRGARAVQKPLVSSVAACDRLASAAATAVEATGAVLMPILQYRFGEGAARARALVAPGGAGRCSPHRPGDVVAPRPLVLRGGAVARHVGGRPRRHRGQPRHPRP